ncbi:MAG: diguanylate cyclase (GGDEF)-like protein/PAS domain S-box-containing protein [Flavobacteriales bacterium]
MREFEKLSLEQMELVINASGIGVWDWNVNSSELICNERWAEIIGYRLAELQPVTFETWSNLLHIDDLEIATNLIQEHTRGDIPVYEVEFRMQHKQGHFVWILAIGKVIEFYENSLPKRMIGTHLDITQRKHDDQELVTTSRILDQSQKIAKVGGWELDVLSGDLFWTAETYRIYETTAEKFKLNVDAGVKLFLPDSKRQIEVALTAAIVQGESYDLELQTYTTMGRVIDVRTTCVVTMENNTPVKLTGIFQDISEQKTNQRRLEKSNAELAQVNKKLKKNAYYDALTGLPNRNLLADRMRHSIKVNKRKQNFIAIAFLDLDGFKDINDLHGHSFGDDLLCCIAEKIKLLMRGGDTLARFGGDEFVMILDDLNSPDDYLSILQRTLDAVSAIRFINHKWVNISASIGVTIYPQDNSNSDQLIRHADQAMYIAKQLGKNCLYEFDVANDVAVINRYEELESIRAAFKNNEFVLYYQPKINIKTNEIIGLEALIRWNHPQQGLLPPSAFLPIIEQNMLIIEIGEWVIETALKQLTSWTGSGIKLPISVNISPLQLQQADFVSRLKGIFLKYPNFKAGEIEFEILETIALDDIRLVRDVIKKCHQIGIIFSIDDFGTGYSSLTYLKKLPTEHLKIDRSFVIDMLTDQDDCAIVHGIIQLAHTFERTVIAEGVETIAHGEKLLSLGCHLAQGFGISRPMPAIEFPEWLNHWKQNNEWQKLSKEEIKSVTT